MRTRETRENTMTNDKIALSIGAHPDDAEFMCAGTLALLHERGWEIHIATMTPGDCGTVQYSREEIRIAFWVARCATVGEEEQPTGLSWLKENLLTHGSPELVLRHHGRTNPRTGVPAKRWLDELLARIDETNEVVIGTVLSQLPEDMQKQEESLFEKMEVAYSKR